MNRLLQALANSIAVEPQHGPQNGRNIITYDKGIVPILWLGMR